MFIFVSGAVRSGKSSWAEEQALLLRSEGPLIYLATACVRDQEMRDRVLRHQEARKSKGFKTLEQHTDVSKAVSQISPEATVLLECLGTLLANEMFGKKVGRRICKNKDAIRGERIYKFYEEKIYGELLLLKARAANLLVVSNDIFSDGVTYEEETENYLRTLGALHVKLARDADRAVECVCGQAFVHKQSAFP